MKKSFNNVYNFMFIIFFLITFLSQLLELNYLGEIITCLNIVYILIYIIREKKIEKNLFRVLILCLLLGLIGVFSNMNSSVERTPMMMLLAYFSHIKVFISFVGFSCFFNKYPQELKVNLLNKLATVAKTIIVVAIICYLLSCIGYLNMSSDIRYGIKTFKFIFNSGAWFSQYWMIIPFILLANMEFTKKTKMDKIFFFASLAVWCLGLRTRAFVIIAAYIVSLIFIGGKNNSVDYKKRFFNLKTIVSGAILAVMVGYDQISNYFLADKTTARSLLLKGGFKIMKDFFPLGSGLGTFGTEIAKKYYSPLYYKYGLSNFWALSVNGTELTDCYWPAIAAEFGFFGLPIVAYIVYNIIATMISKTRKNKYLFICVLIEALYLIISSTATGIFFSDITALYMFIVALIINCAHERRVEE